MTKVYVVGEIGYEYNDEYYVYPETNSTISLKAFTDKEKAEEYKNRLNKQRWDEMDIDCRVAYLGGSGWNMSEEDLQNLQPIDFYTIEEVEME